MQWPRLAFPEVYRANTFPPQQGLTRPWNNIINGDDEIKPPNLTHVHCYNIVFGAVRVMWRWLANRYVKCNFDSTYSDPWRLYIIKSTLTFLQELRKKTIRNLCYLNRMRAHTHTHTPLLGFATLRVTSKIIYKNNVIMFYTAVVVKHYYYTYSPDGTAIGFENVLRSIVRIPHTRCKVR
jgi:hypothetical protein